MYGESTNAAYKRDGFAVILGMFSAEEMEEIVRQLEAHLRLDVVSAPRGDVIFEANAERSLRCLFRIHERSEYFDQLMRDARLMRLVQRLFPGAGVIADGTMLIDKVPVATYEFPWHQDNAYPFWNPPDGIAKIDGLQRTMHQHRKRGAVIEPDQPREKALQTRCAPAWDEATKRYKLG